MNPWSLAGCPYRRGTRRTRTLYRPPHPTQAISRLHETHQVISPSPNFGYALVTRRSKPHHLSSFRLSHWKAAFNGAEPIRPKTLADFDAKFEPCGWTPSSWACLYGLAETCVYGCGVAEPPVVLSVARDKLGPGDAPMLCHESDERADADIVEFPGCFIHPSEARACNDVPSQTPMSHTPKC
eukprot:scaffold263053_cov32-Tisochrysis_lutea.AAC.5